jgi:hypothetical protein
MTRLVLLATGEGLLVLDPDGEIMSTEFPGQETVSVAAGGGRCYVAVTNAGVYRRAAGAVGDWEHVGLTGLDVWVVAAGDDGTAYAGLEPAALWRLGPNGAVELAGLASVEGHDDWHSPWGPADLSAVVVDGARLVVGVEVGGVAVSSDGGANWEARNDGLYEDVHAVAADGPCLYATTGMGFYRSLDEGKSWAWESDGLDRGYTQGLSISGATLLVASASGPPPLWEDDGAEAAIFRASAGDQPLSWTVAFEEFSGNVERQALAAVGDFVVAGTSDGELLVGGAGGTDLRVLRADLPPITGVALFEG